MADHLIVTDYDDTDAKVYSAAIPFAGFSSTTPGGGVGKRRNVATDGLGNWIVSGNPGQISTDDGATWSDISISTVPFDVDSVVWTGDRFLASGFDGGNVAVSTTTDLGVTWDTWDLVSTLTAVHERCGFARIGGNWVTLERDINLAPAKSTKIRYFEDPPTTGTIVGASVVRDWDVGVGLFGVGNQYVMPMPLASNEAILLAFSIVADDLEWTEDPTAVAPMTAATFTGTGQIWCAIWDGAQWIGGGQYDDAGTLKFNWATSADGKAWTHHNEPTFGRYCLVDAFFDGSTAWFSAVHTTSGVGAVFEYDGASWTRHDLPAGTTGGFGIDGFPFDPVLIVTVHAGLSGSVSVDGELVVLIHFTPEPGTVDVDATVGATVKKKASLSATVDISGTVGTPSRKILAVARGALDVSGFVAFARRFGLKRRTVLTSTTGEGIAELELAVHGPITWEKNKPVAFSVELGIDDPKAIPTLAEKFLEAALWVGDWLAVKGPMITPSADEARLKITGQSPDWYLDRRLIGKPSTNRLTNGNFDDSLRGWTVMVTDENFGLHGADDQCFAIALGPADIGTFEGDRRACVLFDATFPKPNDQRQPIVFQEVELTAGPFGLDVYFEAYCFTDGSGFPNDPAAGLILARLPLGYRSFGYPTTGTPLPPAGYGNLYWASSRVVDAEHAIAESTLDNSHPFGKYELHRVTVRIPPNQTEVIHCRLNGRAKEGVRWARAALYADDALEFFQTDLSDLVAGLVAHAQDPAFDQSDVNVDALNAPTGVLVDRRYPWLDRYRVLEAIGDLAKEGFLDWWLEQTPTTTNLRIKAPRRDRRTRITLELGRNVSGFAWAFDGESAASMIAVLAQDNASNGPGRPEGKAIDTTDFAGGLTLQAVLAAPFGTPVSSLDNLAAELLKTVTNPHTIALKLNAAGRDLIGKIFPGDIAAVKLNRGALSIVGTYELVRVTLTPDNFLEVVVNERTDL